jgi:hypothetical protein
LEGLYQGMAVQEMEVPRYEGIDMQKRVNIIIRKLVDKAMTYFNFKNQNNSMYWQRAMEVEKLVRRIITPERVSKTITELDNLYAEVFDEMQMLQHKFMSDYLENEQNNIGGNEKVR